MEQIVDVLVPPVAEEETLEEPPERISECIAETMVDVPVSRISEGPLKWRSRLARLTSPVLCGGRSSWSRQRRTSLWYNVHIDKLVDGPVVTQSPGSSITQTLHGTAAQALHIETFEVERLVPQRIVRVARVDKKSATAKKGDPRLLNMPVKRVETQNS